MDLWHQGLALPSYDIAATRLALHRLAVYVISPARRAHTGRIGLRATNDGFGTPAFVADGVATQVRVEGGWLVVEADGEPRRLDLVGARSPTLREAASFVGVELDLDAESRFDVPPPGDLAAPLAVRRRAAVAIGDWFRFTAALLRHVGAAAEGGPGAPPSTVQLWPEHFDMALDLGDEAAGTRVNVGGSPGDGFSAEPYLYVGPWQREGLDDPFWNAPFGATLGYRELVAAEEPLTAARSFVAEALDRLDAARGRG